MAVKQAGLAGKVYVFGYDGSDQLTSMILSGDNILLGSVAQDPYTQGYKAVEALVSALKGETDRLRWARSLSSQAPTWAPPILPRQCLARSQRAGECRLRSARLPTNFTMAGVVFQDDQFMNSMVKGFTDAAAKYGVKILTANTNNDQSKEAELIQTYIAQGVNGIAIAPLSKDASIANLKEAAAKGIKVAITNMSISDASFLAGGFTSDDAPMARSSATTPPSSSRTSSGGQHQCSPHRGLRRPVA